MAHGVLRPANRRDCGRSPAASRKIDDAFLEPFLIVKPTGMAWNNSAQRLAMQILERFDRQYQLAFRGRPRVKDDKDVAEDLAKYHVVLFGDPGSNAVLAKLVGKLPLGWTKDKVTMGDVSLGAGDVLPAMIYPNPLAPAKYMVLNSGIAGVVESWAGDFFDAAVWRLRAAAGGREGVAGRGPRGYL